MEKDGINIAYKRMEQKLSQIGAKIADATDLSRQAKELASGSERLLINAQKGIDDLYISLGDDDPLEVSED